MSFSYFRGSRRGGFTPPVASTGRGGFTVNPSKLRVNGFTVNGFTVNPMKASAVSRDTGGLARRPRLVLLPSTGSFRSPTKARSPESCGA